MKRKFRAGSHKNIGTSVGLEKSKDQTLPFWVAVCAKQVMFLPTSGSYPPASTLLVRVTASLPWLLDNFAERIAGLISHLTTNIQKHVSNFKKFIRLAKKLKNIHTIIIIQGPFSFSSAAHVAITLQPNWCFFMERHYPRWTSWPAQLWDQAADSRAAWQSLWDRKQTWETIPKSICLQQHSETFVLMLQALKKKNYHPKRKHTSVKLFFPPTLADLHSF